MTCAVVGVGISLAGSGAAPATLAARSTTNITAEQSRSSGISRDAVRQAAPAAPAVRVVPVVTGHRWSTAALDLRLAPEASALTSGELKSLSRVAVTGLQRKGFAQVVVERKAYWVTADYLVAKKPVDPTNLPLADKPCPGTSGVESGLKPGAIRVYRAVCNNFPEITQYGGYDAHGEHRSGKAIDIMTSDVTLGTRIADFLRAHAAELNLFDVIWQQHIFTPERAGEGWRAMPDRGSATANHRDHVHVSVN